MAGKLVRDEWNVPVVGCDMAAMGGLDLLVVADAESVVIGIGFSRAPGPASWRMSAQPVLEGLTRAALP